MKENDKPSKVYLVSQQASDSPSNRVQLPVSKDLLYEYKNGMMIEESPNGSSASPVAFPVGYVIEHDNWGVHEQLSDNFERLNNVISNPVYTGVDVSHLEGELLTIVDASFADKRQCESIKSLMRNTIWQFHSRQEKKVQAMYESVKDCEK